jgi:hypothetical protein
MKNLEIKANEYMIARLQKIKTSKTRSKWGVFRQDSDYFEDFAKRNNISIEESKSLIEKSEGYKNFKIELKLVLEKFFGSF